MKTAILLLVCAVNTVLLDGKCWRVVDIPPTVLQRKGLAESKIRVLPQAGLCPSTYLAAPLQHETRTHDTYEWCEPK